MSRTDGKVSTQTVLRHSFASATNHKPLTHCNLIERCLGLGHPFQLLRTDSPYLIPLLPHLPHTSYQLTSPSAPVWPSPNTKYQIHYQPTLNPTRPDQNRHLRTPKSNPVPVTGCCALETSCLLLLHHDLYPRRLCLHISLVPSDPPSLNKAAIHSTIRNPSAPPPPHPPFSLFSCRIAVASRTTRFCFSHHHIEFSTVGFFSGPPSASLRPWILHAYLPTPHHHSLNPDSPTQHQRHH